MAAPLTAAAPRALPEGTLPNDARLQSLKDLNGYFPFTPCTSPAEWAKRAERVRRQLDVHRSLRAADDVPRRRHHEHQRHRQVGDRAALPAEHQVGAVGGPVDVAGRQW